MLSAGLPYEPGLNAKHLAWIGTGIKEYNIDMA